MNENCKDPYTFLSNSECIPPPGLKEYIDSYNIYIQDMNKYCVKSDNIISNPYCNNFVENNKFIQDTEIQKNLKKNIPDLCKNNITPNLNNLCTNTYNIKPDIVIAEEARLAVAAVKQMEIKKKEEEAVKAEEANDQTGLYIGIGAAVFVLGVIYVKNKKKQPK